MKKVIALVLSTVLCLGIFAGCGNSKSGSSSAASTVASTAATSSAEKKTFTVGFDQDFPPFGFKADDGSFTGFDIELATETAKRLGLEIKLQPIDWDAKDMELKTGAIDCIWNGFTMTGREDEYTWSTPYMNNAQVFVVKKDSGIQTPADLKGKLVTVQTDSSAEAALKEDKNKDLLSSFKELVICKEYNTAFMDLQSGAVDAIAMDEGVARYQITTRKADFVVLDESIADEQYAVGFLLGNTELKDKVENVLKEMVKDGTFATISKKWFDKDVCIIK